MMRRKNLKFSIKKQNYIIKSYLKNLRKECLFKHFFWARTLCISRHSHVQENQILKPTKEMFCQTSETNQHVSSGSQRSKTFCPKYLRLTKFYRSYVSNFIFRVSNCAHHLHAVDNRVVNILTCTCKTITIHDMLFIFRLKTYVYS